MANDDIIIYRAPKNKKKCMCDSEDWKEWRKMIRKVMKAPDPRYERGYYDRSGGSW